MSLTITVDELPEARVLSADGELDYAQCAAFRRHIDRILREVPPAVIVDLSRVDYLDSSGLGLLLSLSREYAARGGRLALVTSETVDQVLAITRIAGIFTLKADVAAALESLRGAPPA